eukprot:gene20099-5801_t
MSFTNFLRNPLSSRSTTQVGAQKQFGASTTTAKRSALGEISNTRASSKAPRNKKQAAIKLPDGANFGMDIDPVVAPVVAKLPAGVTDIDRLDHSNPQLVTEYVSEIHAYMRVLESQQAVTSGYMAGVQTEIKPEMRAILVDWLVEVHARFKLIPETLQLTVNIMD